MAGLRQFALMELKITTVSGSAYAKYGESVLLKMFTSSSNIKVCTMYAAIRTQLVRISELLIRALIV